MLYSKNPDSKQSPWMYTKQVSGKSESFSQISEISEESGRQMIDGIKLKQVPQNNSKQQKIPVLEKIGRPRFSLQTDMTKFGLKTQKLENQTIVQSSFLKTLKLERMKNSFIRNLFTNSYIIPSKKKQLLHQKYIKEEKKEVMLEKYAISKIPVLSPTSLIIIIWDAIGTFFNFIILWLAPFLLSFQNQYDVMQFSELKLIITVFLISDILVTLNKGIIVQGILIKKRRKILSKYLKSNASNDLINIVLWIFIQNQFIDIHIFGELVTICQLLATYHKIQKYFSEYFEYVFFKGSSSYMMDLIQLILSIYFFAHIVACFWHYVGSHSIQTSWLKRYELENETCWKKYNYAFYWATMTMTTVGYGDVTAQSQLEIIFVNIVMFLSSGVFAYSMNSIGMILKNIYDAQQKYKRSLLQMNNYMSKNQVEPQIQSRIRNYLKYYIECEQNENLEDVNNLIQILPNNLQYDLKSDIQNKIINQVKVLTNYFSKGTQLQVSKNLELVKFAPGDLIYKKGDIQDQNLYFLVEGEVILEDELSKMKFSKIKQMETFGFYQFFTNFPPKTTARSVGFTNIYKISRKQFLEILQFNKKDFEKFHQIKDQIIYNQNFRLLDLQCQFCDRYNHQEIDCPVLTYQPDIEQRLKKSAINEVCNRRIFYKRKIVTRLNSREKQQIVANTVKQFHQENQDMDQTNTMKLALLSQEHKKAAGIIFDEESVNKTIIKPENQFGLQNQRHTFKEQTYNLKEFCMLDEIYFCNKQNQAIQIDQQQSFENYYPQGNLEIVMAQFSKTNNKFTRKFIKYIQNLNKYSYYFKVKLKALKLRIAYTKSTNNV